MGQLYRMGRDYKLRKVQGGSISRQGAPPLPPVTGGNTSRGAFARLSGYATSSTDQSGAPGWHNANPAALMTSMMIRWHQWETADDTFNPTIDDAIETTLADAHVSGYSVVIRVMCGRDSPIGGPAGSPTSSQASWMATHPTKPVRRIELANNETSANGAHIYVPDWLSLVSRRNYLDFYLRMMTHLGSIMGQPCPHDSGHTLAAHVAMVPAAAPTEAGTEATLGYGSKTSANYAYNQAQWEAADVFAFGAVSLSQRRAATVNAWNTCMTEQASVLPGGCWIGFATGGMWVDKRAGSDQVIEHVKTYLGKRALVMNTDLRPQYWSQPATWVDAIDCIDRAVTPGVDGRTCSIGMQTAGAGFIPNVQSLIDAVEPALERWPKLRFIETFTGAFTSTATQNTSALGDWPGGAATMKDYLLGSGSNAQARLSTS